MDSTAAFMDGPRAGQTQTFKGRSEPPKTWTVYIPEGEDRYGNTKEKAVVYLRELSIFDDGPQWIYLLEPDG